MNRNKYHTSDKSARTMDGIVFDSLLEARLYLLLRDTIGVDAFELQPSFTLQEKFRDTDGKLIRPIAYKADFKIPDGSHDIIVDTKGMKTPDFKLKLKILKYQNRGIDIRLLSSQKSFVDLLMSLEHTQIDLPCSELCPTLEQALRQRCKDIWAATKQKKPEMIKGQ